MRDLNCNQAAYSLALVLSVVLVCLLAATPVQARQLSQDEIEGISQELLELSGAKYALGLNDDAFENLELGDAVPIYCLSNDDEIIQSMTYYPLMYQEEYVGGFMEDAQGELFYQTGFASALQEYCGNGDPEKLGFIYIKDKLYITDGLEITPAFGSGSKTLTRAVVSDVMLSKQQLALLELADRENTTPLRISNRSVGSPATVFTMCNVIFVTQQPYNKICWAASEAMIYGCHTGDYYSASEVARYRYGDESFNWPRDWNSIENDLRVDLDLGNYHFHNYVPTFNDMLTYIQAGYPIMGKMEYFYSNGSYANYQHHAVVIIGCISDRNLILFNPWEQYYSLTIAKRVQNNQGEWVYYYPDPDTSSGTQYAVLTGHVKYDSSNN